jgi:predicted porin
LSAVYGIEWEVAAEGDDITKGTNASLDLTQRNRFVGIKHQEFGTVKMGKYDTYLKLAQGKVDLFNDLMMPTWNLPLQVKTVSIMCLGYESPKFMNTQLNVMSQTQDVAKGSKAGSSLSIVHHNEEMGLYLALASDMNVEGKTSFIWHT